MTAVASAPVSMLGVRPLPADRLTRFRIRPLMYVELASDHEFTAFLASMTPSMALRERELGLSKSERGRARYLRQRAIIEQMGREARALRYAVAGEPS